MAARNLNLKRLLVPMAALGLVVPLMMTFWDLTFEVHSRFHMPIVMGANRVIRYGFSRIHSREFFDGRTSNGDTISGRCFADVQEGEGTARIHGWHLKRKVS